MSAQVEVWRVSTVEGVFETDLDTLRQWIVEGSVLPTDKVSKGSLNWIDAGRAPMLKAAFNGEVVPAEARPPAETTELQAAVQELPASVVPASFETPPVVATAPAAASPAMPGGVAETCCNHPGVAPRYLCRMCAGLFCDECPKFVSASKIPICPSCGDLCKPF